jgi:hypothetical protein
MATKENAIEILQLQKIAYQSEAAIYNDYTIAPLIQSLEDMITDLQKRPFWKLKLTVKKGNIFYSPFYQHHYQH